MRAQPSFPAGCDRASSSRGEGQTSEVLSPLSSRRQIRIMPAERGGHVLHPAAQGPLLACWGSHSGGKFIFLRSTA